MENRYPSWWDTTLTVFNKCENKTTGVIQWYKHTIHNCFWKYVDNKTFINGNIIDTNDIICRVPKSANFLEKYEWLEIDDDKKQNYFTFGKGDIIIKGDVPDIINEYLKDSRSTDVISKYKDLQGCMVVKRYVTNTDGGRCLEHYYIKGE